MFGSDPFVQSVQNSYEIQKAKWWLLQWKATRTVYEELIIYEKSVVMKIGHLPEATQFTVTEVFTFLITPSSSRLYTLLAKGAASWKQTRQDDVLMKAITA